MHQTARQLDHQKIRDTKIALAEHEGTPPRMLHNLATSSMSDSGLLEKIVQHRSVERETLQFVVDKSHASADLKNTARALLARSLERVASA